LPGEFFCRTRILAFQGFRHGSTTKARQQLVFFQPEPGFINLCIQSWDQECRKNSSPIIVPLTTTNHNFIASYHTGTAAEQTLQVTTQSTAYAGHRSAVLTEYIDQMLGNAGCVSAGTPYACCTDPGVGTCTPVATTASGGHFKYTFSNLDSTRDPAQWSGRQIAGWFESSMQDQTGTIQTAHVGYFSFDDALATSGMNINNMEMVAIRPTNNGSVGLTHLSGLKVYDLTSTGSNPAGNVDAIQVVAQSGANQSGARGNIRMLGTDFDEGHLQLESEHLWSNGSEFRMSVNGTPTSATDYDFAFGASCMENNGVNWCTVSGDTDANDCGTCTGSELSYLCTDTDGDGGNSTGCNATECTQFSCDGSEWVALDGNVIGASDECATSFTPQFGYYVTTTLGGPNTADICEGYQFYLPFCVRFDTIALRQQTAGAGGAVCGIGIADNAGDILVENEGWACASGPVNHTITVTETTLDAGFYFIVLSESDGATSNFYGFSSAPPNKVRAWSSSAGGCTSGTINTVGASKSSSLRMPIFNLYDNTVSD